MNTFDADLSVHEELSVRVIRKKFYKEGPIV
jgi:hypothetical protein